MDHGTAVARDMKTAHRHMTGCTEVDVDHSVMVSFQIQPHGPCVEVLQRVASDVFYFGKGCFWPIDDDRKEVWRTGHEACFTRFTHRVEDHTNGSGLHLVWTHPRPRR